ncbi:SIR2 family NAD-dependent protein deacylase [Caldimonas brevitalea]|uniref:Sir2 family NAD-dependent protein deacetylase n=1 Tax=Caldimonas brevitalea TaxID=413882 RepID=A0A0G3BEY6_9BURK|nr:SIR2 family protein [Caldimonas brevitalea]AKJ27857.1 Sir2 family NAD-dependent protein deacetylase [Caldimonas brevitalea]
MSGKLEQLRAAYQQGEVILFVGAGVSLALGLPPWSDLIDHMATELGFEPEEFRQYGSYLALAEYFRLQHGSIGPLRSWMDREWHAQQIRVKDSKVHEMIVHGGFDIIYTTNYDRWIENAFDHYGKDYVKIVSVADLARIRTDVPQIVKFHGDFENDESIVLDETSYFRRLEFESPLDIKLRADVLGRSVLFIGYSLADINIRYLFYKLAQLWKASVPGLPQPKSYIFSPQPNPVQEAVLAQWGIEMLTIDGKEPSKALQQFLESVMG